MQIHPLAGLFPEMNKQELQELADDIKAYGQRETIKTTPDGKMIIDGINRFKACKIAKVEPRLEALNGELKDIEAFIISQNIARRHLTEGQRALLYAMIHRDREKSGPKGQGTIPIGPIATPMVNPQRVRLARRILNSAPDKVSGVLNGTVHFDDALREAKDREDTAQSNDTKMSMLRDGARDLAELVKEERMEINEALAAMKERERKRRETIETGKHAANTGLTRFIVDVTSIIDARKEMPDDERLLDAKTVSAVLKAAARLENLFNKEKELR
jgi:hypothetical protein